MDSTRSKASAWVFFLLLLWPLRSCWALSGYLDSLHRSSQSNDDDTSKPFGMPAEEYYGHTNPMASNWPGSKHQDYGGYLKGLNPGDAAPHEWYGKSNPMASWEGYKHPRFGGYLDSLQGDDVSHGTLAAGKPSDYGDDVRWGADVYLKSLEREQ